MLYGCALVPAENVEKYFFLIGTKITPSSDTTRAKFFYFSSGNIRMTRICEAEGM
jgi:hypothetical protein